MMQSTQLSLWFWIPLVGVACGSGAATRSGGETGTEGNDAECGVRGQANPIGEHAVTAYGSPTEVSVRAAGQHTLGMVYWNNGGMASMTDVTITVTADVGSAQLVQHAQQGDSQRVCASTLELNASVRIETKDGAFREEMSGKLEASKGRLGFEGSMPFADLTGSYTPPGQVSAQGVVAINMLLSERAGEESLWEGHLDLETDGSAAQMAEWYRATADNSGS